MARVRANLETSTAAFTKMADTLASFSKRNGRILMEEQVRGVIRNLIIITPPSNGKTRGVKAKKLGEAAIASDVRKVFVGSTPKMAEARSMEEMSYILRRHRKRGSIRTRLLNQKTRAARSMIRDFIKNKQKMVGYWASGWASAARGIGKIRVPNWIDRHSAPGHTEIKAVSTSVTATISNLVSWGSEVYGIERRMAYAAWMQTGKMRRRVRHHMAKAIKAADR